MTDALDDVVAGLLLAIQAIAGYPVPAELPQVAFLPHRQIEAMACAGPCPVFGWTPHRQAVIYLDDGLDPRRDLWARGVLVHELVHFQQDRSGRFAVYAPCVRVVLREREAIAVQTRWLHQHDVSPLPAAPSARQIIRAGSCMDDRVAGQGEAFAAPDRADPGSQGPPPSPIR